MARPCKSAKVLTECSQTKEEITDRINNEELIRGKGDNIVPSQELNENQLYIFDFIISELNASGILSNLDRFLLTKCAISIDRLQRIESMINKNPSLMFNKEIKSTKDSYDKDFYRCCNELCLSPQSRAKIANINLSKQSAEEDPVVRALRGE